MDKSRLTKGFLIAPLVPGIIWAIYILNPVVLLVAVPIAYLCTLVVGLPLFYFLYRLNKVNLVTVSIGGILASIATPLIFAAPNIESYSDLITPQNMKGIALFIFFGIAASTTFWVIAVKEKKSDKSLETDSESAV